MIPDYHEEDFTTWSKANPLLNSQWSCTWHKHIKALEESRRQEAYKLKMIEGEKKRAKEDAEHTKITKYISLLAQGILAMVGLCNSKEEARDAIFRIYKDELGRACYNNDLAFVKSALHAMYNADKTFPDPRPLFKVGTEYPEYIPTIDQTKLCVMEVEIK